MSTAPEHSPGLERLIDDRLSGVCPVLAVPFFVDGSIDLAGFDRIVDHQLECGVNSLLLFGFASEFYKLSDQERSDLRSRFVARVAAAPQTASIVSITEQATVLAVRAAKNAVEVGADALNVLPPHYLSPSASSVDEHLRAVLSAVDVPVVLQLAPALTGGAVNIDSLLSIAADHANLAAIKVETIPPGASIATFSKAGLPCLVGYAGQQLPDALDRGAVGLQPGCSIVEVYLAMWQLGLDGDHAGLRAAHQRLLPHISYWMQQMELIIQIEKTILFRRGLIGSDHCRAPGRNLDAVEHRRIDQLFIDYPELANL